MYYEQTEKGTYVVKKDYIRTCDLEQPWKHCDPVREYFILGEFNTEEECKQYIINDIHRVFERVYSAFTLNGYVPDDINNEIKKLYFKGATNEGGIAHMRYTIKEKEEIDEIVNGYTKIILDRRWLKFKQENAKLEMGVRRYSEDNIELYRNSQSYENYKKVIAARVETQLRCYVSEPIPEPILIPPKNAKEAANNMYNNFKNRKKAPTLTEGWIVYIAALCFEIILIETPYWWFWTTVIFFAWRRNEIRKYNGLYTKEEREKLDPWKKKY